MCSPLSCSDFSFSTFSQDILRAFLKHFLRMPKVLKALKWVIYWPFYGFIRDHVASPIWPNIDIYLFGVIDHTKLILFSDLTRHSRHISW